MKRVISAWVVLAVVLWAGCPGVAEARATTLDFYVRNKPFQGQTRYEGGRLQACLSDLLTALGFSWTLTGEEVVISRQPGGGPLIPDAPQTLVYEGQPLQLVTLARDGQATVDVGSLAEALGLTFRIQASVLTADLSIPVSQASAPAPAPPQGASQAGAAASGGGSGGGMIETDGSDKRSPIQILENPFSDSTTPGAKFVGEVRTSARIRNGSPDKELTGVVLRLLLVDGSGETVQEWVAQVGSLKPGQEFQLLPEPPVWYNYNQAKVFPKVLVKHQALEQGQ